MRFACLSVFLSISIGVVTGCAQESKPERMAAAPHSDCVPPCIAHDDDFFDFAFEAGHAIASIIKGHDERLVLIDAAGREEPLAELPEGAFGHLMTADGSVLFTTAEGSGRHRVATLQRVPLNGGGVERVAELDGPPGEGWSIAANGDWAATMTKTGKLTGVPLDGSPAFQLESADPTLSPKLVALDEGAAYWRGTNVKGENELFATPRDEGPARHLVTTNFIAGIAFDAEHVYVAEGWLDAEVKGSLLEVPKAGGPVKTLFRERTSHLSATVLGSNALAVASGVGYFANGNETLFFPLDGSARPAKLASGDVSQLGPTGDSVFLVSVDSRSLLRFEKPAP